MATFNFFNEFPPEIQFMIFQCCSPNDRTCLSLASKRLYALADHKGPISLETTGEEYLCGSEIAAKDPKTFPTATLRHPAECHELSRAEYNRRREMEGLRPVMFKNCRNRWRRIHCECFTRTFKLHHRLRTWVPSGMRYCGTCSKFTRRKKQHNWRCYHGRPKQRRHKPMYWSHTSVGGGCTRKTWKSILHKRSRRKAMVAANASC
ncbi:hypothetical protein B0O99DRAFT_618060 [Bisporella sp. PMI_857]|nr:hypothetical protein B0O99DRAFT_618060 [Bisporella sp. PMI_857]